MAEEFRAGAVTDREQLPYLLIFVAFTYVVSDTYINSLLEYDTLNFHDVLMLPISLIVGLGGTVWCYKATQHAGSEGGFISRYICLGIPVFVQLIVAVFVVMLALFVVSDYVFTIPGVDDYLESEGTGVADIVLEFVIELIYFWWLRRAIRLSYTNS